MDEAYADFADGDCVGLVADHPNVIVTRTLSKGSSLAGLRVGYLIARPEIVAGLVKVKDSYNCDTLSLLGGAAALDDAAYLASTRAKILATRERLAEAMRALGYTRPREPGEFRLVRGRPARRGASTRPSRRRNILVRLMRYPGRDDGLRITVGTDEEIDALLDRDAGDRRGFTRGDRGRKLLGSGASRVGAGSARRSPLHDLHAEDRQAEDRRAEPAPTGAEAFPRSRGCMDHCVCWVKR